MRIQDHFQPLYKRVLFLFPIIYFLTRVFQNGMGNDPWHPYFFFLILPLTWYILQRNYKWFEERNYIFVETTTFFVVLHGGLVWLMNLHHDNGNLYFAVFFNSIFVCGLIFSSVKSLGFYFSYSILLSIILLVIAKKVELIVGFTGTIVGAGSMQVAMLMNRINIVKKLIGAVDKQENLQKEIEKIKEYKNIVFDNADYKYVLIDNEKTIVVSSLGFFGANQQTRNWCIGKHFYEFLEQKSNLKPEDKKKIKGILEKEYMINGKSIKYKSFTFKKIKTDIDGLYNILIIDR